MEKLDRKGHLKRSGKRWLALLMSVCLIGTMIPVAVRAEELTVKAELGGATLLSAVSDITYLTCDSTGQNWTTGTCENATEVTNADTAWGTSSTDTWYVVNGTMTLTFLEYHN